MRRNISGSSGPRATRTAVTAERGLLRALGGSCQVPVAGKATLQADRLTIKGLIASLDGRRVISDELSGPKPINRRAWACSLAKSCSSMGAGEILAEIAQYGADR